MFTQMILTGLAGMIIFVKWENHIKYPIFDVSLFKSNRVFALSNLAALIHYSATFAVTFLLSLYLQYIKLFDPQITGIILMSQPIMMALFSSFAGKLSDRIEPRIIATIGMSITCSMLLVLSFIQEVTSLAYVISCLLLMGVGCALFSSPNMNIIMSSVEKKSLSMAAAIVAELRSIGMVVSLTIISIFLSIYVGQMELNTQNAQSYLKAMHLSIISFTLRKFSSKDVLNE